MLCPEDFGQHFNNQSVRQEVMVQFWLTLRDTAALYLQLVCWITLYSIIYLFISPSCLQ